MAAKIRDCGGGYYRIFCPGCKLYHLVNSGWKFNGDFESPTITPSIRVTYGGPDAGEGGAPPAVCHSFVTGGRISFCDDTTHALKGQTVELRDEP